MDSPELLPSLLKIGSALAVTVGILIVVAYLFRKIMQREGRVGNRELVRVLSSRYVGPKSSIMLVDAIGHIMVIGVSSGTISLLAEIMDPESLELLKDVRGHREKNSSFSDYLKGYLKRSRLDS